MKAHLETHGGADIPHSSPKAIFSFTHAIRRRVHPSHGSSDPHRQERMKAHLETHEIHEGTLVENRCHVRESVETLQRNCVRVDLAEACLSFDSLLVQIVHYESCLWQQNRVGTWVHMIRYGIQPSVLKRWYSH